MFYVVWDYVDERLFDKRNSSDCAQFSELLGWPTSGASSRLGILNDKSRLGDLLVHLGSWRIHRRYLCRDRCLSGE